MQRVAIVVFATICVFLSSCLDEELPVLYDTYLDVWIRDENGNNLLDPAVDGFFDHDGIKLYYVSAGDTTEVFHPRQDAPRNLSVLKNNSNNEFFLRILPDEGRANDEETTTILEWKPGVNDNIKCLMGRTEHAVYIKKVWYNDQLSFDIEYSMGITWGDKLMGRFIQVRKSH